MALGQALPSDPIQKQIFLERAPDAEEIYKEFKSTHNTIIGLIEEKDFEAHDDIRLKADTAYYTTRAIFHQLSPQPSTESSEISSISALKLNKLALPTFSGNHKEWHTFFDLYRTMVHENKSLSSIAKYQYLLMSLSGEAFNLLKGFPVTDANYEIAYKTLKGRYQNKRHLATLYFNEIVHLKPLKDDSSKSLRILIDTFHENIEGFRNLGFPVDKWDFLLFNIVLQKLNTPTKTTFEAEHTAYDIPTYKQLVDFLEKRAKALESVLLTSSDSTSPSSSKSNIRAKSVNMKIEEHHSNSSTTNCILCHEAHPIYRCTNFTSKSAGERLSIARDHNLCRNCLSQRHTTHNCSSSHRCRTCNQHHHTLLHFKTQTSPSVHVGTSYNTIQTSMKESNPNILLPIAIVKIQDRFGKLHRVKALIDSGSMSNFITSNLSKRLQLPRKQTSCLEIQGLNAMTSICNKGSVTCSIQPIQSSKPSFDFDAIITPSICSDQPSIASLVPLYPHLQQLNIPPEHHSSLNSVDLLLGAELVPQIITEGRLRGEPNHPIAVNSVFGWILMGRSSLSVTTSLSTCLSTTDYSLDNSIQRFWELESIPERTLLTCEEDKCENHFKNNYKRTSTGRFIVSLPFKKPNPVLGNSYQTALKRFMSLENRLLKTPSLRSDYINFMKDYLQSGHMSLANSFKPPSDRTYYIPHHCVLRSENPSSKIRVVFDASAPTSNGTSLNDTLLVGHKLQQDIIKVLSSFRCFKYAFVCDIQQMYRQILVSPEDRNFQRILWRFSSTEPIQEYILNTVTYGVASAPFLALRTLVELSNIYCDQFPRASTVLKNNIYVDDIVTGAQSVQETLELQRELIDLLNRGGFKLRKWASNCTHVLQEVSETDLQRPISMDYDEISYIKVLGLQWDPTTDDFKFSYCPRNSLSTKRSILSEIARVYDPLGFLTPCTLKAKQFIQQLWQLKIEWDESPPGHISKNWEIFKKGLIFISDLRIPRLMIPSDTKSVQLHLFCDASQSGYCAVAYLRCESHNQSINTSFLCGKSRVAPLKTISIPRLELCGAVLLVDLLKTIKDMLSTTIIFDVIYAWSDSKVTLAWISSLPTRWKIFVANRVSYIQEILPSDYWRYIPSSDNPADCGSRGLFPDQLIAHDLWWRGPSWLCHPPEYWPSIKSIPCESTEVINEQKSNIITTIETKLTFIDTLLMRFSSLSKIQRIMAYIQRFIIHCRKQNRYFTIQLSPFELQQSLSSIVRYVQHQHFSQLFTTINENKIPDKSFRKLAPFLDRDGLIRVGGRIKFAMIPFDHKHPLLLPKNSRVSELIVEHIHEKYLHPGQRSLQALVMRQYWIIASRSVIHRVVSRCIRCFRCKPRSYAPRMADLPQFRVTEVKAFSRVAVDFAGPIYTTISRTRGARFVKSYICVFVCTSTKAIHLELVSDLSTEAFIAALRRFTSRRGRCTLILSDQGTNFVGAYNKLREMAEVSGQKLELTWQFHPPGAPHFNGLAEAGVRSVKSHLIKVIGDQKLTFEEVYTILTQIEAVLNSRPLSAMTEDPNDLQPLTPAHFLCLEPLNASVVDPDVTQVPINRLDRWKLIQKMVQDFWKRWHVEYLYSLQQRGKWNASSPTPSIGDLVLIRNEQRPPLQWETGRIEEVHPGIDGVIRVITIKTKNGRLTRPTTKICTLPI
ncbi:uncharacterized protein [Onthophagus taurus]|uniref:uncharacterized protein n=1 Tax=Onthophagus taurus TaxID=166361 RepID=UPI0039BE1EA9